MQKVNLVIAAVFLTITSSFSALAEEIRGSQFGYGNWSGAAYSNNETGLFSHCVVSAIYKSGDTLFLSVTEGATVVIGVSNRALRFVEGESFPVTVNVDRRYSFNARARAISSDTVMLEIADFERALNAIMRGLTMRINSATFSGVYSLKGTMRALDKALKCAVDNLQYARAPKQQGSTRLSLIEESKLYQLSTKMIATLGAQDFNYLTTGEIKNLGFSQGVFWYSKKLDVLGGTMALQGPEGSIRETDAGDISFMNSLCRGDFASKSKGVEHPSVEQRELNGYCVEGDKHTQYVAVKTKLGAVVVYNVLIFGPDAELNGEQRAQASDNVAIQSARFVESNQ